MFTNVIAILLACAVGYLFGSLCLAIIISKTIYHKDIRGFGSGNAGMANVQRVLGWPPAVITLIGDFGKCVIAILLSRWIFSAMGVTLLDAAYPAGLFALLGHLYPVYFGFRGGKGVLTAAAVVLLINPPAFLICITVFLICVASTMMVSLGSISAAICFPIATGFIHLWNGTGGLGDTLFAVLIAALIVWVHRANIKRILAGTEARLGGKKK